MSRDNNKYTNRTQRNNTTGPASSIALAQNIQAEQYRTLFEMLPQGTLYYDASGHLLAANSAAQRIPGLLLASSGNASSSSLLLCDEDGHPLRDEEHPLQRVLAGESLKDATAIDIIIRGPENQERLMNVSGNPIYDSHGQLQGALLTLQDVSEQRNAEHRTQRSLNAILAMAEAMVQRDEDREATVPLEEEREVSGAPRENEQPGESTFEHHLLELPCRLLDCQRAAIILVEPQTEVLTPIAVVGISPEYEQHWRNSLHGARLSSLLGSMELVDHLRSGEMLPLDASHQLFRDLPSYKLITPILKNDELLGIFLLAYGSIKPNLTSQELAIIHAIASLASLLIEWAQALQQRNQALEALQVASAELERTSKAKGDFLGIVSHEFRTALTGIQGFSEIMRDKELSIAEMKEFAIDIHTDARRLVRMIAGMLDTDQREASHLQLNPGWLDLNAIIIDVVVRIRQANPGAVIRLQLANALPILRGDYEKLTLVVSNLLQNAIQHSHPGGEIAVSSQIEGNVVHVYIRDYGVGLPATELERIFEPRTHTDAHPIFHIEDSQPELSIVREIVQMHGGQVWAESVLGKGSIFHFTVRFTNPRQ
ncbi:MAG: PAS domain-containing protein [Ktedonobacteraceae bacterium]|nr:PAS domain-containing protein [Ktedonobacteraceae bacterium]